MNAALRWEMHDDRPAAADSVDRGLGDYNAAAAPLDHVQALCCFVYDADGQLVGGAVGRTWGACCELQQLWVDSAHRRHGIGSELVRRFERRAGERGCTRFYLDTFTFQAPALYRSLGYRTVHAIEGFPDGIAKHLMVKEQQ